MKNFRCRVLFITISVTFVCLGHLIVIQRSLHGRSPWFQMSPDAKQYIRMVKAEEAIPPYCHRFLVPFIASLLPMSADSALRVISYLCLILTYCVGFLILDRLRFDLCTMTVSSCCLFASTGHLLFYQNPYLTDAFGLMCLILMLYFLICNKDFAFGISACVGVLARESSLFLVPSFVVTKRWGNFVLLLCVSIACYLIPRILFGGTTHSRLILPVHWTYYVKMYFTFGILWIPMLTGLLLCNKESFPAILLVFLSLLLGALISSLVARDTIRMFVVMMPVGLITLSYYFYELELINRPLFIVTIFLSLLNIPLALPTSFFPYDCQRMEALEEFYYHIKWPIVILHFTGFLVIITSIVLMRRKLRTQFQEKLAYIQHIIRTQIINQLRCALRR